MAKANDMKEELLKQMEKSAAGSARASRDLMDQIISRDLARIRRLKWVTTICWLLVLACFAVPAVIELIRRTPGGILGFTPQMIELLVPDYYLSAVGIVARALLIIAVILTLSLYLRLRTLTMRQIQATLAGIEEQLKKISQKQ